MAQERSSACPLFAYVGRERGQERLAVRDDAGLPVDQGAVDVEGGEGLLRTVGVGMGRSGMTLWGGGVVEALWWCCCWRYWVVVG